nr:hypothetical protein CPGR_02518 [Mycolicibacter nonchromogenicus]
MLGDGVGQLLSVGDRIGVEQRDAVISDLKSSVATQQRWEFGGVGEPAAS